ncbi:solute symporter protein [Pandoraea thiooxydans]|uniref:Sodium symporter small subunit domain-containing protein n=1 Tax=Pandoraea thiooxydans TaxID=445709 RepID=A0A0G3EJ27_9BURK|nr:sodium/substrate symporter small subunit [Pandoraea thiooxydans]AKJ66910.1 hypothetical protein ABW99_00340 [Pandoraea thiooxydans]APR93796.1 solute symporter protein [Pandoraea thiooxydans]
MNSSATPADPVALAERRARLAAAYWRRNLALIAVLMFVGFAATFVPVYWAPELSGLHCFGWPLPFYMGAQGAMLVYLLLICFYAIGQRRNDMHFRRDLAALEARARNGAAITEGRDTQ